MDKNMQEAAVDQHLLKVSSSPHIRTGASTQQIMLDVIIALIPAGVVAVVLFGARSLAVMAVSILAAVLSEYLTEKAMNKPITTHDLSAVVTGLLLAYNVPSTMPLWKVAIGSVFAIVVAKQFFGGIGHNFMNPALAGRAFLMSSWGLDMTTLAMPFRPDTMAGPTPLTSGVFAISTASPEAAEEHALTLLDMFLGKMPGMLGEVSALALLIGACYLLIRKVIKLRIPIIYILSFSVFIWIFGSINGTVGFADIPGQILSGGLILGAFYMATDYASSPMTDKGKTIYAIGCGLLTALIRQFGGFPEGVSYSILIMNCVTPLLDRNIIRKPFGAEEVKENE